MPKPIHPHIYVPGVGPLEYSTPMSVEVHIAADADDFRRSLAAAAKGN